MAEPELVPYGVPAAVQPQWESAVKAYDDAMRAAMAEYGRDMEPFRRYHHLNLGMDSAQVGRYAPLMRPARRKLEAAVEVAGKRIQRERERLGVYLD